MNQEIVEITTISRIGVDLNIKLQLASTASRMPFLHVSLAHCKKELISNFYFFHRLLLSNRVSISSSSSTNQLFSRCFSSSPTEARSSEDSFRNEKLHTIEHQQHARLLTVDLPSPAASRREIRSNYSLLALPSTAGADEV